MDYQSTGRDTALHPVLYKPGDPNKTEFVKQLQLISGLIERSTVIYLTAHHFGNVIAELRAQYEAPSDSMPKELRFGFDKPARWVKQPDGTNLRTNATYQLTIVNAGTDSMATVNRMNADTPGAIGFQDKLMHMRKA